MKSKEIEPISFHLILSPSFLSSSWSVDFHRHSSLLTYSICTSFPPNGSEMNLNLLKHAKSLLKNTGTFHSYGYGESHVW